MSGLLAGVILVMGAVVTRKWLVAPESSIAQYFIDFMLMSLGIIMCPFEVALLGGRWRSISVESRPGNVLSWLL